MAVIPAGAARDESTRTEFLGALLEGFRFRLAQSAADTEAVLAVRRECYRHYDVPVPDEYDSRSWFLLAECEATGKVVGTIRITPRSDGPMELEEYFALPAQLKGDDVVEMTRFAILPEYRKSASGMPRVTFGLFKMVPAFITSIGAHYICVSSTAQQAKIYSWLGFTATGVTAPYRKLANKEHELFVWDLRHGFGPYDTQQFYAWFVEWKSKEIIIPDARPPLGVGIPTGATAPAAEGV